ncbi:transcriptional regulator, lysR type [Phaeobacter inhibens]|nr:transcriptional regulator, lysR type [Phaeobacter inhibens]
MGSMAKRDASDARRVYPSMTALRMLEAVSRLGSLHKASEAMFVTPSAVSHQLRNMEQMLGVKLISRAGRKVELTSAGNRYVRDIRKALEIVERANAPLGGSEPFGPLRINCASGLGSYWLAYHITEFLDLFPNIDLEITNETDRSDILNDQSDFSIIYGDGAWPGKHVQHLFTPRAFPVCSPAFLERHGRIRTPEDLVKLPLLHHRNQSDWVVWLSAASKKSFELSKGIMFSDVTQNINAAIAGAGIAIGDDILGRHALREGKLVRLFDTDIRGPHAYYIVTQKERMERRVCQLAIDWLSRWFQKYTLQTQS